MNLFNSLGSNYSARFIGQTLSAKNDQISKAHLNSIISAHYGGRTLLFYKGRDALYTALILSKLPKGSGVAVNAFTCFVVYKAIAQAGMRPVFLDIDPKTLHFSANSLRSACNHNKNIKAVIVQNTLGIPVDIQSVVKICRAKSLILIEDLAHSAGGVYKGGRTVGTVGDFVILSFSQDKIIDGISGGALVIRKKTYLPSQSPQLPEPSPAQQYKDRIYPFLTSLIRKTYESGFGKILHKILSFTHLLSQPVQRNFRPHALPSWYVRLIFNALSHLPDSINHRRKISLVYQTTISKSLHVLNIKTYLKRATFIRFPLLVKNREQLISNLKINGIYVSDIWYDAPIAPKKYLKFTSYKHNAPTAEKVSDQILNLPTHRLVSEDDALEISHIINAWYALQKKR